MTSRYVIQLLSDPALVTGQSTGMVEEMVVRYPYFQTAHLLLACRYYSAGDARYSDQLKKASAYAGDRRVFRALIAGISRTSVPGTFAVAPVLPETEALPTDTAPVIFETTAAVLQEEYLPEPSLSSNRRMTTEELLAIVKKRLAEITEAGMQPIPGITDILPEAPRPAVINSPTKAALIDKFIREEPRISKPKASFFSPTDSSVRSNMDDEEIVSETLARLFAEQGNTQKAIHIYEKLCLINQEKSRYFAAQIEKLGG